ncbi:hypothetical protein P154DRAFT_235710 [Amniculicola lignicola CBS 123094]|uniref:Uncharacterized protein n=1 Tax=Amniculicola lignicola CBS 123094 TaxID=1392246 RepID=A0A6A5WG78_9PLEO|nr:hypothetical protein P154DRAFT_235710 [Amniculicola lignicola CBS 123094]
MDMQSAKCSKISREHRTILTRRHTASPDWQSNAASGSVRLPCSVIIQSIQKGKARLSGRLQLGSAAKRLLLHVVAGTAVSSRPCAEAWRGNGTILTSARALPKLAGVSSSRNCSLRFRCPADALHRGSQIERRLPQPCDATEFGFPRPSGEAPT